MAISAGSQILWSDMANIFNRISSVRSKFGYSTISASSYGGQGQAARAATIQNMKDLLTAVRGNKYATAAVDRFSIAVPAVGSIIYASTMTPILNMLSGLESACIFDNFGFHSCNVFDNFGFNSCNGFNSFNGNVASCSYFNTSFSYQGFSCGPYNLQVTFN